jgi:alkanesulfonate monooxygenase SsuD/methylene tetrahydromethanopterin reductase-like flavin-dependent oxidoreductase (luciferase family)
MTLATTVALPVVRHPAVLAAALTGLAALHPGPVVAGIGPGSGRADYAAVAIPFAERWSRFDAAARELRLLLADTGLPLWSASWGSPARLRALAADADGWIASGYNARPSAYAAARAALDGHLLAAGRDPAGFPDLIATVWLQVTDSAAEADAVLRDVLGPALGRDPADLVHLPVARRALRPGARGLRRGGRPTGAALAVARRHPAAAPVRGGGRAAPPALMTTDESGGPDRSPRV